jgi:transcriptional regulator with XRE-family HTH domain
MVKQQNPTRRLASDLPSRSGRRMVGGTTTSEEQGRTAVKRSSTTKRLATGEGGASARCFEKGDFLLGKRRNSNPPSRLGDILNLLKPLADVAEQLVLLVRPSIVEGIGEEWLERQIAEEKWRTISFPAFDEGWLTAQQPPGIRVGLLVGDLRRNKRLSQKQLGKLIGVSRFQILRLETGRSVGGIHAHRLITALQIEETWCVDYLRSALANQTVTGKVPRKTQSQGALPKAPHSEGSSLAKQQKTQDKNKGLHA